MRITIITKKREYYLITRSYFSKKFQGFVFAIDCDVPQGFLHTTVFLIKLKFICFGFWLSFDQSKIKNHVHEIKKAITAIVDRHKAANSRVLEAQSAKLDRYNRQRV